jgi:hypothetical protein
MKQLLSAAGRAFLRAFIAALIVYAAGIAAAPNLNRTYLVAVAALIGAAAAGIRAIQAYLPKLTLSRYLGHPYGDWADSFLQGFAGSLVITLPGAAGAPDFNTLKATVVGAIVGAFNAGVRAVQGALTPGEAPAPAKGIQPPPAATSEPVSPTAPTPKAA